jgi:hypothetical protein
VLLVWCIQVTARSVVNSVWLGQYALFVATGRAAL